MTELIKDTYRVISEQSIGEYKEKGSKFIAFAFPVKSIADVETGLSEVKALHPKARHYCYAYRIGIEGDLFRTNDDGEPSGTAGKPIFGQLLSHEVSDTFIVVVRYFGGTKLGASGLIHAYKTAASDALDNATIAERTLTDKFMLEFKYAQMGHVMNVIKSLELDILEKSFDTSPNVLIELSQGISADMIIRLQARLLEVSEEQISDETIIPFCNITKIEE